LGFREIIKDPKNIVAIEWAEKIKKILPKKVLKIKFKILGKKEREILIKWQKDC
jgi:tRNA threonylcarbamoyladenosine biosynthesis protein TsaE